MAGAATAGAGVRQSGAECLFPRIRDRGRRLKGQNEISQFPRILCNATQDSLGESKNGQLPTVGAGGKGDVKEITSYPEFSGGTRKINYP